MVRLGTDDKRDMGVLQSTLVLCATRIRKRRKTGRRKEYEWQMWETCSADLPDADPSGRDERELPLSRCSISLGHRVKPIGKARRIKKKIFPLSDAAANPVGFRPSRGDLGSSCWVADKIRGKGVM